MQAETEHLKARTADRGKNKPFLKTVIIKANLELCLHGEKNNKNEEENQAGVVGFEENSCRKARR